MSNAVVENGQTRVAFGDVVRLVRDKVDPEDSGLERYVAGEHMDTDDLRIRGWGLIGDGYLGPAFHMRFKPGHVLYGSRRTYLRKVALADFEGICANTTFVLETKDPKVLLPELLPFVMQTEAFHEHSIKQSKGSVNPYVNFSDLAWYEFALPSLEEQQNIVNVLHSVRRFRDSLATLSDATDRALASVAALEFDALLDDSVPMARLADLCSRRPQSGIYKSEEFRGKGTPMVNMGELFAHDVIDDAVEMDRIILDDKELERYTLTPTDLLFGRRSVVLEGAGRCVLVGSVSQPVVFESSLLRATVDPEQADSRYVFEWFRSPYGRQQIKRIVTFTTVSGVAGSDVGRLPVPLPQISTQRHVGKRLAELRRLIDAPRQRLRTSASLHSAVLNGILGVR